MASWLNIPIKKKKPVLKYKALPMGAKDSLGEFVEKAAKLGKSAKVLAKDEKDCDLEEVN
jgi:hypothetical protein